MRCAICKEEVNKAVRVVHGVEIYECLHCDLGFVDQTQKARKSRKKLYNLSAYKKEEPRIAHMLENHIDSIIRYKKSGSVLDIGAGFGLLSSLLLKKGKFSLTVVEPFVTPYYLKNNVYHLYKMTIDTFLKKNSRQFDIIILFDVIEHLKNPTETLAALRKILKKKGIIVIQTPNYKSLMQELSPDWSWWMIQDHKWFYSYKSLITLVEKTGLTSLNQTSYEDWHDFSKNLDAHFKRFKNRHMRRIAKMLFFIPFTPFYFLFRPLLWRLGFGGLLFSISKK
ncbi:MAG: class I SAM-dependent methyltransferase [Patescibacteria group bacterium]